MCVHSADECSVMGPATKPCKWYEFHKEAPAEPHAHTLSTALVGATEPQCPERQMCPLQYLRRWAAMQGVQLTVAIVPRPATF